MKVQDIMCSRPAYCFLDTELPAIARLMVENDCGSIPVVGDWTGARPVGIITDRDIACRTVAQDINPSQCIAAQVMTSPILVVTPDLEIERCMEIMETNQIRRVPVVDAKGRLCGVVAQADISQIGPDYEIAELIQDISLPTAVAAQVLRGPIVRPARYQEEIVCFERPKERVFLDGLQGDKER